MDAMMRAIGNFLPYDDGSGYRAKVTIEQESNSEQPTITIETIFRLSVSDWPEVVDGIATMLKGFPSTSKTEAGK